MKYAINQIALLKNGTIGTIIKTEIIDGKGHYTLCFGGENTKVFRTTDIKTVLGKVLHEIPGRSKSEMIKYLKGKKASVKDLKDFYNLLASVKIVDDIIDVETNISATGNLSFPEFQKWFNDGKVKERSNISLMPYIGYLNVKLSEGYVAKMLVTDIDENAIYPLFYKVNDMDLISGPCVISISQNWSITPMEDKQVRVFRNEISRLSNMIYLAEEHVFIPKDKLPVQNSVVKMKPYTPDTLPGYLNAVNLYFAGKEIRLRMIDANGNVVFNPEKEKLKKTDYYCLITDLDIDDLSKHYVKEPQTRPL